MTSAISNQSAVKHPSWKVLETHHQYISKLHLRELFSEDPKRGERMSVEAVGLYLDYSKNRITEETLFLLLQLAKEAGLRERIDAMFTGEKINLTENRAVLHTALRAPIWRKRRRWLRRMPGRGATTRPSRSIWVSPSANTWWAILTRQTSCSS